MVKKLTVIVLALILGMGSIISFTSRVSALEAGKIWLNDDDTITYATINDAVAAGNTGDTIRISGLFDTTNPAFRDAVVNNGMTLEVDQILQFSMMMIIRVELQLQVVHILKLLMVLL